MILISITLHNFMSYADAQLDLSSVSVACLSGANGAGKSALLDAMTWAIWEEARASSDELIRLGEREMWVDVRFEHEGQLYKIRRSRYKVSGKASTKSSTKGSLELQVLKGARVLEEVGAAVSSHGTDFESKPANGNFSSASAGEERLGTWRSLTCSSVKETEELICTLLRMDYNTFVNSAYLRQGQADKFTTCLPSERKQILSEILGLSYFDNLQDKCKEHARTFKQDKERLEQVLLQLPEKEALFNDLSDNFDLLETKVSLAKEKRVREEHEIANFNQQREQLYFLKHKCETAQSQIESDQVDLEGLSKQRNELTARLGSLAQLIGHQGDIEQEVKDYSVIKSAIESLERSAFQLQELSAKKMEARSQLSDLKNRLEHELNYATTNCKDLEDKSEKLRKATLDGLAITESFAEYKELIGKEAQMAKEQESFSQLDARAIDLQRQINEFRIRLEADISQKQSMDAQLVVALKEESGLEDQKHQLEEESHLLDKLETERDLVEEKGLTIKSTVESIDLKIDALKRSQREHKEKIEQLQEASDSTICPLCSSPIVDRSAVVAHYQQVIEDSAREIVGLENKQQQLQSERQSLRKQYAELKEKLSKRKDLDKQIGQFNERLAGIKRAEETKIKLHGELKLLQEGLQTEDFAQLERVSLKSVKVEQDRLNFDPVLYSNLQGQVREKRSIEPRYYQLLRDLADSAKLEAELPQLKLKISELKEALENQSYGKEIQELAQALEKQIADLDYDRDKHNELKERLELLLPSMGKYRDLQRAIEERPQLEESLQNFQTMIEARLSKIKSGQTDLTLWQKELEQLPEIEMKLVRLRAFVDESKLEYEKLSNDFAVMQAKNQHLVAEIEELKTKKQALVDVKSAFDDYSFLAEAFGKKGIQAVIIENAIPEIEADANRILARLSDNQMHIALITQQKNKAGNVVETLDILIADSVGTRSYELYSGGEAFKVNFAVRVALSRLLARRSGAKLETLIIDEGFGSQDELSRDRLVKAIRSIQNDFARILIITHFADVREMFPTHILVSKINGLSQIQLLA